MTFSTPVAEISKEQPGQIDEPRDAVCSVASRIASRWLVYCGGAASLADPQAASARQKPSGQWGSPAESTTVPE